MKNYLLIVCLTVLLLHSSVAFAATHSVSPLLIEQSLVPRDGFTEIITIKNLAPRKIRIYPTVNEIVLGKNNEIKQFITPAMTDRTTTVTSWIEVDRGRVEIMPGESAEIEVRFAIHPNAVPGNYYAFVGFPEAPKRKEGEDKVMAGVSPGVVVRLSLPESSNQALRLDGFNTERFIIDDSKKEILVALSNSGDVTATPTGEIILYNTRGDEVDAIPFNTSALAIPAGGSQDFNLSIPEAIRYGKYKAFLNIDYGTSQKAAIYDTIYFTVLPLWWLIIIFGILIMGTIIVSVWYHRSSNQHKKDRDDSEGEVSLYVRDAITSSAKDHDINLKA